MVWCREVRCAVRGVDDPHGPSCLRSRPPYPQACAPCWCWTAQGATGATRFKMVSKKQLGLMPCRRSCTKSSSVRRGPHTQYTYLRDPSRRMDMSADDSDSNDQSSASNDGPPCPTTNHQPTFDSSSSSSGSDSTSTQPNDGSPSRSPLKTLPVGRPAVSSSARIRLVCFFVRGRGDSIRERRAASEIALVHASSDAPVCCCLTNRLRLAGWCPSTVCRLVHQVGCELAAPHNFCSASLVGQAADESHGRTAYELRWHGRQAWMHLKGGRDQHEPDAWLRDGELPLYARLLTL